MRLLLIFDVHVRQTFYFSAHSSSLQALHHPFDRSPPFVRSPPSFTTTRSVSSLSHPSSPYLPLDCALGVDVYLLCHKLKSVY